MAITKKKTRQTKAVKKKPRTRSAKKKVEQPDDIINDIYLPEGSVVEVSNELTDYTVLIYGESAIGKTSTVAKAEGSYVIQCDPDREGLAIRQTTIPSMTLDDLKKKKPDMTPYDMIVGLIGKAVEDDSVGTIVIDNLGMFYAHAMAHKCYKEMISNPSEENDYGATWRAIEDMFAAPLDAIIQTKGKGLICVCHETTKEIETLNGTYDRIEPAMMKAAFKWVKERTDFAFYLTYGDNGDRVCMMRGDREIWLKCCTDEDNPHFYNPEGKPVQQISMGISPTQGWENILKSWNNQLHDINYKSKTRKSRSKRKTKNEE